MEKKEKTPKVQPPGEKTKTGSRDDGMGHGQRGLGTPWSKSINETDRGAGDHSDLPTSVPPK